MNGIVLLDKPKDVTSFQALGILKKRLGTKKVGHTGTLDKFAGGLLIACVGKYTRLAQFITALPKEYIACIEFGRTTDTLDPEGEVVSTGNVPDLAEIEAVLPDFTGEISQRPPAFSAVHIDGRRAYQRVRAGETVEPGPRTITIDAIDVLEYTPPFLKIRVNCRKGTYIRALARDIGNASGSCAYVTALYRTRIGGFQIQDAVSPDRFDREKHLVPALKFLPKLDGLSSIQVDDAVAQRIMFGKNLSDSMFSGALSTGTWALTDKNGELLAVIEKKTEHIVYNMVFAGR